MGYTWDIVRQTMNKSTVAQLRSSIFLTASFACSGRMQLQGPLRHLRPFSSPQTKNSFTGAGAASLTVLTACSMTFFLASSFAFACIAAGSIATTRRYADAFQIEELPSNA